MEERLQKILSSAGVASRRAAEKMIRAGRVMVDGAVVTELGAKYEAACHEITVDGNRIRADEKRYYVLLNKPRGYLSTVRDDRGRKTVLDLLPDFSARLYPVGRLDADTEGLLLITNDGALTQELLHPRYEIDKVYHAEVSGKVEADGLARLRSGILLEDGMTAPARVRVLRCEEGRTVVETIIHEGRNRQVRRMFAAIGCHVCALRRVRFAGLTLRGLATGAFRLLTAEEIDELRRSAGVMDGESNRNCGRGTCGDDGSSSCGRVRRRRSAPRKDAACRLQDDDYGKGALQRHKRRRDS
mgnify:FL=1